IGLRLFQPRGKADAHAPRLLLLRVFALGSRSESLFRSFSLLWRYTGSMRMIAGPDLANATVEPHEFLDFLAGRLQRRFITGPAVLDQRLAETQLRRDPDGRFRVSTFFCHADTWQSVLRRVARESDLVLMDLRGFTSANQGCIFELNELLDAVRLRHLLLLVDDTTDEAFLTEVLQQGWRRISAGSPNRADAAPQVRLYRLAESGATGIGIGTLGATLARVHSGKLAPVARWMHALSARPRFRGENGNDEWSGPRRTRHAKAGSIDRKADFLDHLAVPLVVAADEVVELLERGDVGLAGACRHEPLADFRQFQRLVHLGTQLGEHRRRRSSRREQALPDVHLIAVVDLADPRQVGQHIRALGSAHRERPHLAALDQRHYRAAAEHGCDLAADYRIGRGRAAFVGHVRELEAARELEHFHGEVMLAAIADRAIGERRVGALGECDEAREVVDWHQRGIDHQHELVRDQCRNRRERLRRIDRHLRVEVR